MPAHPGPITRPTTAILAASLGIAIASPALAQLNRPPRLQPVEPGYADVGPVGMSTRVMSTDLRQPAAFDQVYHIPGSTRGIGAFGAPGQDRFARVDGAITAVFPRSDYTPTQNGVKAVIPPSTVFYIGRSPLTDPAPERTPRPSPTAYSTSVLTNVSTLTAPPRAEPASGLVDLRVHPASELASYTPTPPAQPPRPPSRSLQLPAANILADEQFRRTRLRQLLTSADE